jgi:hypothetical protein
MEGTVIVDEVLIVRQTDFGWFCEIDGAPLFVGRLQIPPGTEVPPVGQRGSLTLTVNAARDLGLVPAERMQG